MICLPGTYKRDLLGKIGDVTFKDLRLCNSIWPSLHGNSTTKVKKKLANVTINNWRRCKKVQFHHAPEMCRVRRQRRCRIISDKKQGTNCTLRNTEIDDAEMECVSRYAEVQKHLTAPKHNKLYHKH